MSKTKRKNWKIISASLDEETIGKLEIISSSEGMSKSDMLDFLINNWEAGVNPESKLENLLNDRKRFSDELNQIEEKIKKTTKEIKLFKEWNTIKRARKEEAIKIIERKILEKDFSNAERISKVWQRITGISAIELLIESKENIEKRGI